MKLFFYLYFFNPIKLGTHNDLTNIIIPEDKLDNELYKKGYDFRPFNNESIDRIIDLNRKKYYLDFLQNNNIPINSKLELIENDNILNKKTIDIFQGGLLDDFNFEIF